MSRRAARCGPRSSGKRALIRLNSVDLPAPFGPMMAWRSPVRIARSTPRMISVGRSSCGRRRARARGASWRAPRARQCRAAPSPSASRIAPPAASEARGDDRERRDRRQRRARVAARIQPEQRHCALSRPTCRSSRPRRWPRQRTRAPRQPPCARRRRTRARSSPRGPAAASAAATSAGDAARREEHHRRRTEPEVEQPGLACSRDSAVT